MTRSVLTQPTNVLVQAQYDNSMTRRDDGQKFLTSVRNGDLSGMESYLVNSGDVNFRDGIEVT